MPAAVISPAAAGRWNQWYDEAIPLAEHRYETYLKERAEQEGER